VGGCWRCGAPTVPGSGRCVADHAPLRGLAFRRAALAYAGTGGALVRRFKFQGDGAAGLLLIRELARVGRAQLCDWPRQALVLPIPVHARKRRARGFDQAARLADGLAAALGLPCGRGVLVRDRETRPQGDPRTTSREANVAGAFRVARRRPLVGRQVVLVDDVTTSGATARECARVLLKAGARRVGLLTAASS
jgi:ComF family protein